MVPHRLALGTTKQVVAHLDFTPISFLPFPYSPDTVIRGITNVLKNIGVPAGYPAFEASNPPQEYAPIPCPYWRWSLDQQAATRQTHAAGARR